MVDSSGVDATSGAELNGPAAVTGLIDNREWIDATTSIAAVNDRFAGHRQEFMAVCDDGTVAGICSRSQVQGLLSGRYGFALYSRLPIGDHLLNDCIVFSVATPLREVLATALSREGDDFYHDVVIADDGRFVGLVSTRRLVAAQSALIQEQFDLVDSQREELEQANADLSRSIVQQQALERRMIQEAKAALLDTIAGGVAHEINNKLMPIVGYAELVIEELASGETARLPQYARTILEGAVESSRIIAQLLQLSRPARTEWDVCDLATVVRQSLTLVALRIKETGTRLELDLPTDPVPIRADAAQLKQLLMNLVLNAIDAVQDVETREVAIHVAVEDAVALVSVSDRGVGIAPEHLARIFDPFFTTKAPNRGTGLGLGVCASIVKQHGSEITVSSTQGRGSVFSFMLPVLSAHVVVRRVVDVAAPARAAETRTALVIEDDDVVARVVMEALRRQFQCRAERATDGEGGRRALLTGDFDAVLCDVRMPGMNGIELVSWIRHHRADMLPRVVLMTGDAGSALNEHIEEAGVPILRKPFTVSALATVLRERCGAFSELAAR